MYRHRVAGASREPDLLETAGHALGEIGEVGVRGLVGLGEHERVILIGVQRPLVAGGAPERQPREGARRLADLLLGEGQEPSRGSVGDQRDHARGIERIGAGVDQPGYDRRVAPRREDDLGARARAPNGAADREGTRPIEIHQVGVRDDAEQAIAVGDGQVMDVEFEHPQDRLARQQVRSRKLNRLRCELDHRTVEGATLGHDTRA